MLGGGGETEQEYASRSRPRGLGCAKHLSPLLLHADNAAALTHRTAWRHCPKTGTSNAPTENLAGIQRRVGPKSRISASRRATQQACPRLFGQFQKWNSPKFAGYGVFERFIPFTTVATSVEVAGLRTSAGMFRDSH
jgi:hypothetical protein